MTENVPYRELKDDIQVMMAIVGKKLPSKPENMCTSRKALWGLSKRCWDYSPDNRPTVGDVIIHLSRITSPTAQRRSETVQNSKRKNRKDSRHVSFAPEPAIRNIDSSSVPMSYPTSATQPPLPTRVRLRDDGIEDGDASTRHRKEPSPSASPPPRNHRSALAEELTSGQSREGSSEKERDDASTVAPARSELKPPKLVPSSMQLFFTDWIRQRQMQNGDKKLNVAQTAKEASAVYANMTTEQKEVRFYFSVSIRSAQWS